MDSASCPALTNAGSDKDASDGRAKGRKEGALLNAYEKMFDTLGDLIIHLFLRSTFSRN